ncbi:transcription termination/antitermination protein NusG [[Acholeplasma] multilocale]|uniref:transcription termination/antitermination protein NusG n=1 Tax=[Acholeplasma] multilocale TaxID=264638 RepID=UPI000479800B|nr:transcription termination/antitermination protein NusG [[Acholeplasma] multilocale]
MSNIDLLELEDEILSAKGQWFVINCNTGHEDKVHSDLTQKIKTSNLENEVFDVRISKGMTTTKAGKQVNKNRFPGYIFINMIMSEKAWFIVRNTPGVTGFIGSSGRGAKPFPLTTAEVLRMLMPEEEIVEVVVEETVTETPNAAKPKGEAVAKKVLKTADFEVGEIVGIKDGLHKGEEGEVKEMDYSKGVAIIAIEMFGRYTTLEISFDHVQSLKED